MSDRIIETLKSTRTRIPEIRPPLWARSGHAQTILGHLLPSRKVSSKSEYLNIPLEKETERIHSTYLEGTGPFVLYLFHGLGGTAEASYMHRTALIALGLGFHVFMNNHRGCGLGAGLAAEPYHSGSAEDLAQVIKHGRSKFPAHKHVAIGFSLSANALLLLCAKVRADVQPDFAIAVNGPINLDRTSRKLQQGLNKLYDQRFVKDLEQYIRVNRPGDLGDYSLVKDLRTFDELYTAKLSGFRNRAHYYETCSSKQYLTKINIPTVILTAEDDPFVSVTDYREASYSECCVVHIEKHGGHMGYLSRSGVGYTRWLDSALKSYLVSYRDLWL